MKNFRQILEGVDYIDENVNRQSKELAKEIGDAARRETGSDKKDFETVSKLIGQNKHRDAAKYMSDLDTAPLEDLITFVMGHQDVFKKMYPKAKRGQYVAQFARQVEGHEKGDCEYPGECGQDPCVTFGKVDEAMSDRDKKKRLAMIKKAVEKINKGNADKAKKDALAMMKASGMFDEEVELDEAKVKFYGSEISGLRDNKGGMYTAKPVEYKGKLAYRVVNQFGDIETIDLKTFAKRFG
tara:strand:+ start:3331 stop:4050 length:720 start_codon:yes stop_codon:yes gene_type:complete